MVASYVILWLGPPLTKKRVSEDLPTAASPTTTTFTEKQEVFYFRHSVLSDESTLHSNEQNSCDKGCEEKVLLLEIQDRIFLEKRFYRRFT